MWARGRMRRDGCAGVARARTSVDCSAPTGQTSRSPPFSTTAGVAAAPRLPRMQPCEPRAVRLVRNARSTAPLRRDPPPLVAPSCSLGW
eukprot:scaffold49243_cov50-Phaeocystis_antarctica.AAC.4